MQDNFNKKNQSQEEQDKNAEVPELGREGKQKDPFPSQTQQMKERRSTRETRGLVHTAAHGSAESTKQNQEEEEKDAVTVLALSAHFLLLPPISQSTTP